MAVSLLLLFGAAAGSDCCADEPVFAPAVGLQNGTLVICGGGILPESLRGKVIELAGGERARMVVVATASLTADSPDIEMYMAYWRKQPLAELTILHTRSREVADSETFVEPLKRATGVWFIGGNQAWLIDTYSGTRTEKEFHKLLERGGVIGGTSAGAAVMSSLMIRRGNTVAEVGRGFGFLEGAVVDQHFVRRQRQDRLLKVLEQQPQLVGLGIDEGTALVASGRRLAVLGDSEVRLCFARTANREPHIESLRPGDETDLIALSRMATARLRPVTPVASSLPQVRDGTLVIVGGANVPTAATERFLEAAGGADAQLAVVSLDGLDVSDAEADLLDELRKAGAKNVQRVSVNSRREADDPRLVAALKTASGIWFSGSRAHTIVESCLGTAAEQLCRDVLRRGGVIGGTAAGGCVQGEVLVKASPLPDKRVLVEGYDRGFGFLPGVAIAGSAPMQESSVELSRLKQEHPAVVGLGIDDATALIVKGHVMEVVGKNQVAVFDGQPDDKPLASAVLEPGDRYDFKDRSRLSPRK